MADQAEQNADENVSTPPTTPPPISQDGPEIPSDEEQTQRTTQEEPIVRQYRILNRLTAALVFVAIVSILVNCLMWNQAKRQADAADSNITQTKQSIALSKQIAETQERFAKIDARAYIMLKEIAASQIKCGDSITINAVWMNVGHTPANEAGENHIVVLVPNSAVEKIYTIAQTRQWPPIHNINSLGPGMTGSTIAGSQVIHQTDSSAIVTGKKVLLTYGMLTYTDIFGDGDTTRYCFRFNPRTKLFADVTSKPQGR